MPMIEAQIPEMFQWSDTPTPEDCYVKISPSRIASFFEYPKNWFLESVKGRDSDFQGNTSTTIGTICHYIFNGFLTAKKIDRNDINAQLLEFNKVRPELELNVEEIMVTYPLVAEAVVNDYLIKLDKTKCESEKQVCTKVEDTIYLAGSCDLIVDKHTVVDFKIVGKKPDEYTIPFGYKIQLLAYAYALRKMGYPIEQIMIVYGVKPTKTLPARVYKVPMVIAPEDDKLISDTLDLISQSVLICKDHPELVWLLFKSAELR